MLWPSENCYSEVPQSKVIEPKEPSVGEVVKVKVGTKFYSGKVVGFGSKDEVEKLMLELESGDCSEEDEPVHEKQVHVQCNQAREQNFFFFRIFPDFSL